MGVFAKAASISSSMFFMSATGVVMTRPLSATATAAAPEPLPEERPDGVLGPEGLRAGDAERAKCEERGILVTAGEAERGRAPGNLLVRLLLPPPPLPPPAGLPLWEARGVRGSCRLVRKGSFGAAMDWLRVPAALLNMLISPVLAVAPFFSPRLVVDCVPDTALRGCYDCAKFDSAGNDSVACFVFVHVRCWRACWVCGVAAELPLLFSIHHGSVSSPFFWHTHFSFYGATVAADHGRLPTLPRSLLPV